jgi:transposase
MIQRSLSENYKAAVAALDAIPGIGKVSAEQIIAETGTDMERFGNPQRLCSWAGVCPGNNESAGKRKSGKTPPGLLLSYARQFFPLKMERIAV